MSPGWLPALLVVLSLPSCRQAPSAAVAAAQTSESKPAPPQLLRRQIRATGSLRAVKQLTVVVPQIAGQSGRLTLAKLVATGTPVQKGDLLAEFDRTQQLDNAREAQAKYDDFSHQVEQKKAENRANAERRASDLQQAEADLAKSELQLSIGPILAEIERLKNEVKLADARAHIASLKKSHAAREVADTAAFRILELKADRQKVALERTLRNAENLLVKAPLDGMVALENTWRSGSMGPPQEGDSMYPGQPLLRIFDPSQMEVYAMVGEPDGAILVPGAKAVVRLDAYPGLVLNARLHVASPVAASAIGSPLKRFAARFRLENSDPHLLPDLQAAVIVFGEEAK